MMRNSPLLSVIVPVYNTAPWLRRCLDSICAQSYRNLEILCVNDGSTDNSAEILAEYAAKDARIKVFTQANAGLSAARNTALDHATGEWVTGVDSDDYLYPGVYEQAVGCISDEVDMVFFGVQEVAEDGSPAMEPNPHFILPEEGQYEMSPGLAEKLNVCFWSKLWRRSVMKDNALRFPVGLLHEDTAMYYLFVPFARKVAVCPALGYAYVQRDGSIMHMAHDSQLAMAKRYVQVAFFLQKRYRELNLLKQHSRFYLVEMMASLCKWFHYLDNDSAQIEADAELRKMVKKSGLWRENYCMEKLLPVEWWCRPFLSRYEQSRVWRFFFIPVFCQLYNERGVQTGAYFMAWDTVRSKIFRSS